MKVVLPDSSELELPDGATGLDAARAIGPKLAEQAVLARVDGSTRDLRLPLADGEPVQFLTTRDTEDPDALSVLRHSTAHLLAEAVMRLHPGVKIAIGPPIADGFYYDFEFPEPISEGDLEAIEEEIRREIAEGREWTREELSREEAIARFEAEGQPYKVELAQRCRRRRSRCTRRASSRISAAGRISRTRRRSRRSSSRASQAPTGAATSSNTQLTRIYGTAFYSQADLDAHLERLEEARARDHRRLGTQLDLFHFDEHSPGSPLWHPKGMVLYNQLEAIRRRENARRGYLEVKTPLIYDKALWVTSGHWDKFRENMFLIPGDTEDQTYGIKPMNCPGHMLLFGSQLRSYRDLPIRYAEAAPLHRNELGGTLHGLTRVRYVTQDDAHIFCTEEQIAAEVDGCIDYVRLPLRPASARAARGALDAARGTLGTDEQWDTAEGRLAGRARAARPPLRDRRGRGHVLRPEDRPAHDGRPRSQLADGDDPVRHADARAVRAHLHGRRQPRAHAARRPPRAVRLVRAVHRDPRRALRAARSRSGSRPCRCA